MKPLPEPPSVGEINVLWLMSNKDTLAAYMQRVKAMEAAEIVVTKNGTTTRVPIRWSDRNATFEVNL